VKGLLIFSGPPLVDLSPRIEWTCCECETTYFNRDPGPICDECLELAEEGDFHPDELNACETNAERNGDMQSWGGGF
jgi:hypothetical protein